ncbi:MAG: prephenate dehydrogenase/arogenate dehydrogenase family protein [Gammaproteobacteria bacterium]|nr:prephenate dehydrogenase/arogenate dehydrogenase family protein [Gammaproteobacteria bacterium]
MFNRVVIVGVGLLGGSLARDLRQQKLAAQIIGVCRSRQSAAAAESQQIVDRVLPLDQAVVGADLIVLATPMQAMITLLQEIHELMADDTILTDVGSVKNDLYQALRHSLPDLLSRFVLAHPIAGGENSGISASRVGMFEHKHVIITGTDEVADDAVEAVSLMWQQVGAKVINMSLQQHDAIFAKTSHLPHMVAFSLVNYLSSQPDREQLFDLAAAGFYDFTRIASSNAEMWRDICITNKDEILHALDGFTSQLADIREHISNSDQQGILEYFSAAKTARDAGLLKKQAE